MPRYSFGGSAADFYVDALGNVLAGVGTVWTAQTGGTQVTDILDMNGGTAGAIKTSLAPKGQIQFLGPNDGTTVFWVDFGGGRVKCVASDGFGARASLGFRNHLNNGDLGIRQRGNGPFTVSGLYTADGVAKVNSGGTHTVNVVDLPLPSTGNRGYINSVVAAQSAAGDFAYLYFPIESVRTLSGQQVTLSFTGSCTLNQSVGVELLQTFGTGGSPSADVVTTVSAIALSGAEARYSVSLTVPSVSSKTLGTSGTDHLRVTLWLSSGSANATRASSIGIQNATINIWDFQLETGPDATTFERMPISIQQGRCERYFRRFAGGVDLMGFFAATGSYAIVNLPYRVRMRSIPTVTTTAAGGLAYACNFAGGTGTANLVLDAAYADSVRLVLNANSTAYTIGAMHMVTSTTAFADLSAEL